MHATCEARRFFGKEGEKKRTQAHGSLWVLRKKERAVVDNLITKIKAWEKERGTFFLYDKVRLLDTLEEYNLLRQQREEDKRRSREQKKLQEQLAAEQEVLFGSKPSPMRQLPIKKPLGQSSNVNMAGGTPTNRRVSTPAGRYGVLSSGKEKRDGGKVGAMIPVNYVALPKDDSFPQNISTIVSP